MIRLLNVVIFCALFLLCSTNLGGSIRIDFKFIDNPGVGFNKPGNEWAKQAVYDAGALFGSWFMGDAHLLVEVLSLNEVGGNGRSYPKYRQVNGSQELLNYSQNTVLRGLDFSKVSCGFISISLERSPENAYESIKSTTLHELTHVFGFKSELTTSICRDKSPKTFFSNFDTHIADSRGVPLVYNASFNPRYDCNALPNTFTGHYANLANQHTPVRLYSSSFLTDHTNHVNDMAMLMSPYQLSPVAEFSKIEIGIMRDLGYCFVQPYATNDYSCVSGVRPFKKVNFNCSEVNINDQLFKVYLNGASALNPSLGNEFSEVLVQVNGAEILRHPLKSPQAAIRGLVLDNNEYDILVDVAESSEYNVTIKIAETWEFSNASTMLDVIEHLNEGLVPLYVHSSKKAAGSRSFTVRPQRYKGPIAMDDCLVTNRECLGYVTPDSELVIETLGQEVGRMRVGLATVANEFTYTDETGSYLVELAIYPKVRAVNAYWTVKKLND